MSNTDRGNEYNSVAVETASNRAVYPEVTKTGEPINMDDVSNAEAVLVRLIQERKSLESAQQVLQTYRMVKSQLEPEVVQLKGLNTRVEEAQKRLADVEGSICNATTKVDAQVMAYRERVLADVEAEVAERRKAVGALEEEYRYLLESINRDGALYETLKAKCHEELDRLNGELREIKKEHATLSEAINKAAGYFSR